MTGSSDLIGDRPALSAEERKLDVAKYYELPLNPPGPLYQQILDNGPIDAGAAIKAQDFLDLLQPTGYSGAEYGYCQMEDGTGYVAVYRTYPNCTPEMLGWWWHWVNVHPKNVPEGRGNLKYRLMCPVDHWDHFFMNENGHADKWGGVGTVESLDLGHGEAMAMHVRHAIDVKDCGLTEEREQELKAAGCWVDCAWESFYTADEAHTPLPGTHIQLTISRMSPLGFMEERTREWIGYYIKDGKVVRDENTPAELVSLPYMRKLLTHQTIESQHLARFLPDLYSEYKDRPADEL